MFENSNASRSFTSLTIDEIRWLNASNAFGDDEEDVTHTASLTDAITPQSVAIPKNLRAADLRRRSILLDDFLGTSNTLSRRADPTKTRFGISVSANRPETPPPSPDDILPATPPRTGFYSATPSIQEEELPPSPPRPTEWIYRRPRSPSSLSRSPSSLSRAPSSISRSPSSSRSVTPTPSRLRTPTSATPVAEMNMSPFYSTVIAPAKRSPSIRTGSPGLRRPTTPSRSSPNLLDFRGSPRVKPVRPQLLPIHRERSGSASSFSTNSSTSSLPQTPPSPSLYSFAHALPEKRVTTPTRSILAHSPKRSPSTSTKRSSASKSVKSVKFDGDPGPRDRKLTIGDGRVRGEEWNSQVADFMPLGIAGDHEMDVFGGDAIQAPPLKPQSGSSALKRFLTLRTRKSKPRPEISGPFALTPSSAGNSPSPAAHRALDPETQSLFGVGSTPPSSGRFRYHNSAASSSSFLQNELASGTGAIPSSPNGGSAPSQKKMYAASLLSTDELGALPPIANKFYSHPARFRPSTATSTKAASVAGTGSVGVLASDPRPVLHALPSMESFRSVKSSRSCSRFRGFLGRIGIGVAV